LGPEGRWSRGALSATAQVAEESRQLLELIGEESLRRVAVGNMEGFTNDEIAEQLDCSLRIVARKLETIRIIWGGSRRPE
jgi:hypothetical protein